MSNTVFSFTVAQPYSEEIAHPVITSTAGGGRRVRRQVYPNTGLFVVNQGGIKFPRNSISTWDTFWAAMKGGYDSFLYKATMTRHNTVTAEALGTASGGGGETFALDSKHIDAANLTIKAAGVTQTLTTDYALSLNNSAPLITTTAAFDTGAVTATYEFYYPCVFGNGQARPMTRSTGATDAEMVIWITGLTWGQDRSGSHLV